MFANQQQNDNEYSQRIAILNKYNHHNRQSRSAVVGMTTGR